MNEEEKINLSGSFKMPGLPDVEKIKKNVEGFKKFLNKPLKYDQNHKTGGESYSDVAQRMKTGQEPPAQQQTSTYTGLGGGIGKFLDQAAKTGKEAADNVMTGKHINVMPEDGKKKIKEEGTPLIDAFLRLHEKQLMGSQSDFKNFQKYNQGATYGQYLNTIRGLTAKTGSANDPSVIAKQNEPKGLKTWDPNATAKTQTVEPAPTKTSYDMMYDRINSKFKRDMQAPASAERMTDNQYEYERNMLAANKSAPAPAATDTSSEKRAQDMMRDRTSPKGKLIPPSEAGIPAKTNNEETDYVNPAEKLRMPKDMTGGAYAAPGPVMKYHPVTLPKDIAKAQPPVEVRPTDPERLKKPIVPVKEANITPQKETPWSGGYHQSLQGTSGSGTVETGQSGSTGPDYSETTPKQKSTPTTPKYEDGGKKGKKMSEENNKLIDMFLKLQEKHALTPNIFEAAKKAKEDHDGDGKIESEKDEYFGSRFAAAKKAGKMEEELKGNQHRIDANKNGKIDAHDFKLLRNRKNVKEGDGDETAKKETSMSVTMDNKPSTPAQTTAATSGPSAADKKALDTKIKSIAKEEVELDELSKDTLKSYVDKAKKDVYFLHGDPKRSETKIRKQRKAGIKAAKEKLANEEVEFSQAEIDHINSFFEAVAPSRAEPTKGVNPSVSNISLTDDTLEEGRPRKNPTPETTERDARQHIQVQAGRAAGGTVVDFKHDNGKVSKLTPGMGRAITAHLNGLKPAERQEAVKRMHASPEGLKV